jgi:Na+-transporting NADH:ubiquinone oxidoreductase subunit NqrD
MTHNLTVDRCIKLAFTNFSLSIQLSHKVFFVSLKTKFNPVHIKEPIQMIFIPSNIVFDTIMKIQLQYVFHS